MALSTSWADSVRAFNLEPVGIGVLTGYAPENGRFPWQGDYEAVPIALSLLGDPDFEAIAATAPDLILADFSARNRSVYDRLSEIAPTIAPLSASGYVDSWHEQTRVLGSILNRSADAENLIAGVDASLARARASIPCLGDSSFLLATLNSDTIGVVADPRDPAAELLAELGMELLPAVTDLAGGKTRLTVSYEQSPLLFGADVTLLRDRDRDRDRDEFQGFSTGRTVFLDGALATALSDPSVQNVEYVLDELAPELEALCAAGR
ncbi:ABC transporter substrate-binding protein [Rhodococcus rhodochrous]|uniref:ABC transporter substrate-binding protein n=1 Tax=Rhodococcus rhodochrous TaxID=1829 RepID=UPI001E44C11A|nr:ABC transporter substrate-binding protein [Rhodococcus rhodochrous]